MSTPFFKDQDISVTNSDSWPDSPDRNIWNSGKKAWSSVLTNPDFKNDYDMSVNLSSYKELLESCQPVSLNKCIAYKKDPVLLLTRQALDSKKYIVDDTFLPKSWSDSVINHHARINKISNTPALYTQALSLIDFEQEKLGDCGFVSTIGAISVHPEGHNLLFSSIYPSIYNPMGLYSVRVISEGEILYVLVDDDFPRESYSDMVNSNEFWFYIIEKTFAKINGGYQNLGGGFERYFGIDSTENHEITDANRNDVWDKYFKTIFHEKGHTTYQGTGSDKNTKYLVSAHAYAVIDAAEWNNIKLVRLHNPWNVANYEKEFSPNSKEWDSVPDAVQKTTFQRDRFRSLSGSKEVPKTFWMPYDYYRHDIPKISELFLSAKLPAVLKSIAHSNSIQK